MVLSPQFNHEGLSDDDKSLIEARKHIPERDDRYPKTRKMVIGFEDIKHGVTTCTTCAKGDPEANPKTNPFIRPIYNTEYDSKAGDLVTCSAYCGKTIVGNSRYYD